MATIQVEIKGPGAVAVALLDPSGNVVARQRLTVSGDSRVVARLRLPAAVETTRGEVATIPVLLSHGEAQAVTFAGKDPGSFLEQRCGELKLKRDAAAKLAKAARQLAGEGPQAFDAVLRGWSPP